MLCEEAACSREGSGKHKNRPEHLMVAERKDHGTCQKDPDSGLKAYLLARSGYWGVKRDRDRTGNNEIPGAEVHKPTLAFKK